MRRGLGAVIGLRSVLSYIGSQYDCAALRVIRKRGSGSIGAAGLKHLGSCVLTGL